MRRSGGGSGVMLVCGTIFLLVGVPFLGVAAVVSREVLRGRNGKELLVVPLIFGSIGAALTVMGTLLVRSWSRARRRQAWLLEQGEVVWAEVTGFPIDYSVRINGRHAYRIECRYIDPLTGISYFFVSSSLWRNPPRFDVKLYARVYVDRDGGWQNYFVDTDSLFEELD